jgi:type I restriction enzyme M protein
MIFLKYVSDSFDIRRDELTGQFKTADHEYFLDPEDFGGENSDVYQAEIDIELEERDYYTEANVFRVPKVARWESLLIEKFVFSKNFKRYFQ